VLQDNAVRMRCGPFRFVSRSSTTGHSVGSAAEDKGILVVVSWNGGTKLHGEFSQKTPVVKYPALSGQCNC